MRIARSFATALVLVSLTSAASTDTDPYIVVPPPLAGDLNASVADVSGDGRRVVGTSIGSGGQATAVFWDDLGPATPLDAEAGLARATAISDDGSTIIGTFDDAIPYSWTALAGALPLPNLEGAEAFPRTAFGVSPDGSTVVGNVVPGPRLGALAAIWNDGVLSIFTPEGHPFGMTGRLWSVSATGRSVGFADGIYFVSDGATIEPLFEATGLASCWAQGISADGHVWVGSCNLEGTASFVPVRWAGDGTELASLSEAYHGFADDVSADGSVVVGTAYDAAQRRPFVWTATDGFAFLEDRLESAGVDTSGVPLGAIFEARVSADGRTVVGDTFIARIPEPESIPEPAATLAGVAALAALPRLKAWRARR